ncbi:MAG: hypothetical protein H7095_03300 [Pseudopedobacter sp.]|nr:hypothetical protein [Deinococcales bacterium]
MKNQNLYMPCPVCGEEFEFTPQDLLELHEGDIIGCDSCDTELEVIGQGETLELTPLEYFTLCPRCETDFELSEEVLLKGGTVECPHCYYKFEPDWQED